jgi:carboxypeptidase Q
MKKTLLSLTCLALGLALRAQTENVDLDMMQKIRNEEMNHSGVTQIAQELTDGVGPRLTGSPGFDQACAWAVQTFQRWGLKNAAKESWGTFGKSWTNHYVYAAMTVPYYHSLIAYARAWSPGTGGKISGKVVLLDALDSANVARAGSSLKGAIVMILNRKDTLPVPLKPDATRLDADSLNTLPDAYMIEPGLIAFYANYLKNENHVKQYLHDEGALALLNIGNFEDGTVYADGDWLEATGKYPSVVPELSLATEDYLRLQRLAQRHVGTTLDIEIQNEIPDGLVEGYNVVAEIPGTDPSLGSQVVMLGGHLDCWQSGTGATDNGAGCIIAMEAVRLLQTLGAHPKRTIRVALWGGEEEGLLGSYGYVKKHFGSATDMHLTPEQKKVSVYFNLDNGTGKIRGIYTQNNSAVADIFRSWLAPFADLGATGVTPSNTGSTDHLSFDAVGIPGFQFIQDPLDYESRTHHTNMDVYDHLSIPDLKQAAIIMAAFVYDAAMRPDMMPRKPLPKPGKFIFDFDGLF